MNNNKNLQEADVSTFGALLPVAAVGLAAGGYLAAKGIGSFRNFLANRAKKKSDAEAAAVPAPTPVPAPAPVPVDNSAKLARIAARKKERLEQEASYQSNREAKVQGIISTYGEVGRAVGASKTAAAAAAAARQAALDKAHDERQDQLKTSALTRDERLAKIAADAASKAGERETARDTANAAREDKKLEYVKNKEEREALRIAALANQAAALAAQAKVGEDKNKIIQKDRTRAAWQNRRLTNAKIESLKAATAAKSSLFSRSATTPATPTSKPSPAAAAGKSIADTLNDKSTATESKPTEVSSAATAEGSATASTTATDKGKGSATTLNKAATRSANRRAAEKAAAEAAATVPAAVPAAAEVSAASTTSTGTGRARRTATSTASTGAGTGRARRTATSTASTASTASTTSTVPTETLSVPPLGRATRSTKPFPFTPSPTISVSNQKSGIVPTKTVLTNVIPVNTSKKQEPDGLTAEQLKTKEEIKQEGLGAKRKDNSSVNELTNSTHYYVTSILKNLLG